MKMDIIDIPYKKLKEGYTYIVKLSTYDVDYTEINVIQKMKNAVLVCINPRNTKYVVWKSLTDTVYKVLDQWKTEIKVIPEDKEILLKS